MHQLDVNSILAAIGLGSLTASAVILAFWSFIKLFIEKRIELQLKYNFDRLLMQQKTVIESQFAVLVDRQKSEIKHQFDLRLDQQKAENTIIVEKTKQILVLCNAVSDIKDEISEALFSFHAQGGPDYVDKLIHDFHPKYKRRFVNLRAKFENSNDLFSSYSLMLDRLLHPKQVKEIIGYLENPSRGNVRFIYHKIWLTVAEVLRALDRVSTSYNFWRPTVNYGERADKWASHDYERILVFLKGAARTRDQSSRYKPALNAAQLDDRASIAEKQSEDFAPFYISLEEENGHQRFWDELPASTGKSETSVAS